MPANTTARRPPADLAPLFAGVLRSEARKLATVRSTTWAVLAAVAFNTVRPESHMLGPWAGFGVFCLYAAAALAAGFALIGRRDA